MGKGRREGGDQPLDTGVAAAELEERKAEREKAGRPAFYEAT